MKKNLIILLLLAVSVCAMAQKAVYITAGQSNTDGRLYEATLPSYANKQYTYCKACFMSPYAHDRLGQFPAFYPTKSDGTGGRWAYDAITYYFIERALKDDFYVIKTSYGGSSIDPQNSCSGGTINGAPFVSGYQSGYHWSADETFLSATGIAGQTFTSGGTTYTGQSLLKALIANIDAAIDGPLAKVEGGYDFKCMFWHQGESDRLSPGKGNYYKNLKAVVAYVRNYLVKKTGNEKYARLPFICGTIPHASSLSSSDVESAMYSIEREDENFHVIDLRDLTMLSDAKHFDAPSAELFGKRIFNRMIGKGIIEADSLNVKDAETDYSDFKTDQFVGETTTWTFNEKSGSFYSGSEIVNGMYLHGGGSTQRRFEFATNKEAEILTYPDGTAQSTSYVRSNLGSQTAATAVSDSWNASHASGNCIGVNVKYPGTLTLQVALEGTNTFSVCFNGKVVKSITGGTDVETGVITPVTYTANKAGTYYIVCGGAYKLWGARYTTSTDRTHERVITTDADGYYPYGNVTDANVGLPDGLRAFVVAPSTASTSEVTLTEVPSINKGTAVLLRGEANKTYILPFAWTTTADIANYMTTQQTTGTVDKTSGGDFVNFTYANKIFTRADGTVTVPCGQSYLSIVNTSSHAVKISLTFNEPDDGKEPDEADLDYTEKSFGKDVAVSDTTTWTFNDRAEQSYLYGTTPYNALFQGTMEYKKMYVHSYASNNRGYHGKDMESTKIVFGDGDTTCITRYMYCSNSGNGKASTLKTTTTASTSLYNSVSVNATLPGYFRAFVSANGATSTSTFELYFNGEQVKTLSVTGLTPGEISFLGKSAGTYYLFCNGAHRIYALRYTPIKKSDDTPTAIKGVKECDTSIACPRKMVRNGQVIITTAEGTYNTLGIKTSGCSTTTRIVSSTSSLLQDK